MYICYFTWGNISFIDLYYKINIPIGDRTSSAPFLKSRGNGADSGNCSPVRLVPLSICDVRFVFCSQVRAQERLAQRFM